MTSVAVFIGIYSYVIFALGITGLLSPQNVVFVSLLYGSGILLRKHTLFRPSSFSPVLLTKVSIFLISLFLLQVVINLIGALGPEYSFDAIWYHLTLPKLYLQHQQLIHFNGGLLYYSDMPKLGEMLYTGALAFGSENVAKVIHLLFGIGICVVLYQYARKWFPQIIALLIVLVFYANVVVAWESTVAYIDLIRTFYEFLSLTLFLRWTEEKNDKLYYLSALILGFAITTKLLALGTLGIFTMLILFVLKKQKATGIAIVRKLVYFILIAVSIPLPWFIFSYVHTHNPIYPFFTPLYPTHISLTLLNPLVLLRDVFTVFTHAADPISPLYLLCCPLLFFFPKFRKNIQLLCLYSLGALLVWYVTPRTGGGRFMLPYLPAFSLIIGEIIYFLSKRKKYYGYYRICVAIIVLIAISTIFYRGYANSKYIPYLTGQETKQQFLINHLNFSFGDFYDIDQGIAKQLGKFDVVLLIGFHNLYYIEFPYVDLSYISPGDRFTYIATQHASLPRNYSFAKKTYENSRTGVVLYHVGEQRWKR